MTLQQQPETDGQHSGQLINVDWLAFSVILTYSHYERAGGVVSLAPPMGLHLEEQPTGTKQFRRRLYLYDDAGDKLLTLLLEPCSKIIDDRTMYVEVANRWLYGDYSRVYDVVSLLHGFDSIGLSRVDVCCDFHPSDSQRGIIRQLADTSAYIVGKREGSDWHNYRREGGVIRVPHQLSWGSKYSDLKFKLYDKVKEITEIDRATGRRWITKPYIVETWQAAGIDITDVWRLEYSLTSANSHRWGDSPINWELVTDRQRLAAWYYETIATRFRIRANEGHECSSNDTELYLINTDTDRMAERTSKRLGGEERTSAAFVPTLRACIRELERDEVRANKTMLSMWLRHTYSVLNTSGLHGYFTRIVGKPYEEYAAELTE